MSLYLHLQCGPWQLLMDVAWVVEIGACDARGTLARRTWRDGSLPVVDLPAVLGDGSGVRHEQVVVRREAGGEACAVVDIDRLLGVQELDADAFVDLAGVTPALAAVMDGAWPAGDRCVLRLRYPFPWLEGPAGMPPAGRSA